MATDEHTIKGYATMKEHLKTVKAGISMSKEGVEMAEAHLDAVEAWLKKMNRHFGQQTRQMNPDKGGR